MKTLLLLSLFFISLSNLVYSQELNSTQLDKLFNSLEKRNEAMGSITLSKNGIVIYERAIGFREEINGTKVQADPSTHYKIWSITKTYTATMIFQLIEEGKLSLETTLDTFYPEIPNAEIITIEHMLGHRSGIFDYVNDTEEGINTFGLNKESIVQLLAEFKPHFEPNENFRYSNSNYLLLGYIIEMLDDTLFEISLSNRISSQIDLTNTHFGTNSVNNVDNKAFTYLYDKQWKSSTEEESYIGHLQTADGGIVSTTGDMAKFIEALFTGKLISQASLDKMLKGDLYYGLGIEKIQFRDTKVFGHTGGWVSESSVFYYPEERLAIAYATNGIVLPKEEILDYVLKIYRNEPFGISVDRRFLAFLALGIGFLFYVLFRFKFEHLLSSQNLLLLGVIGSVLFWVEIVIAGLLHGQFNHIKDGLFELSEFYSNSGTFISIIQWIVAFLFILFTIELHKTCKRLTYSFLPILPIIFVVFSMVGSSLFPINSMGNIISANLMIPVISGPILSILLWRKTHSKRFLFACIFSLLLIFTSTILFMSRPSFPVFLNDYFGVIQKVFYFGITFWIGALSVSFYRKTSSSDSKFEMSFK